MKTPLYEIGDIVGNYTILGKAGKKAGRWEVSCICGTTEVLGGTVLRRKRSCGCLSTGTPKDITGKTLNKLTALFSTGTKSGNGDYIWKFSCDCGGEIETTIGRFNFEHTKSCGCLMKESFKMKDNYHGLSDSVEYRTWSHIKDRCYNTKDKSYSNYGGKGITVDPLWINDFMAFYNHIGKRPEGDYSIDRIDNSKGYIIGNVRWTTMTQQARNKSLQKNNTTGYTGVRWDNKRHPSKHIEKYTLYAKAYWRDENSKHCFRYFSTNKYTKEEALSLAIAARKEGIEEANRNGANYSEKHGKAREVPEE